MAEVGVVPFERGGGKPLRLAFAAGVFDHDAHAVTTVVVVEVAHDPDAGMVHFNDGGNSLRGSEPEDRNANRFRQWIAVHRNHAEGVTGKSEAANLGGAAVQNVKQYPLALLHAHRLAVTQHAAVDGEGIVADFVAVRHALGERGFHLALAGIFESGNGLRGREEVLRHVAAAAEGGLKLLEGEEDFAIVVAGVLFGFDVNGADQAAVLTASKIRSGADVGVVEAET